METRILERRCAVWALFAAATIYLLMAFGLGLNLFAHSEYDSYTLQALRWREGHIALAGDYPWLELAIYEGRYYVSFPPFPVLLMLPLTFLFGANVPSMLVNFVLFLLSVYTGFRIARNLNRAPGEAALFAVGWAAGCNLLEVSLYGGVWNIAQGLSFLLTMLCAYGLTAMETEPRWRYIAPICIACAVGCRPFQAVYVPAVLIALYRARRKEMDGPAWRCALQCLPYVIVPGLIACAYGIYNFVRFGNIFEFGHNYLPEFTRAQEGQFSASYLSGNWENINRMPYVDEDGRLNFPHSFGFAFYLANPLYLVAAIRLAEWGIRRWFFQQRPNWDGVDSALVLGAIAHFLLLLCHKSFGGWQFGTRYLIDLLPMLGLLILRRDRPIRCLEGMILLFAVGFNIYGGLIFHLT